MRSVYVNGYLGPAFALGSGVAQGCPLSPLLFLVVTEALARIIENYRSFQGVPINCRRFLLSLYADDTTLKCGIRDQPKFDGHLKTWMGATAMKENVSKREGLLMGRLNKQRARAPTGVISGDAWTADGDSIRALGAPMGSNLDTTLWWRARYRTVKFRVSHWPNLYHGYQQRAETYYYNRSFTAPSATGSTTWNYQMKYTTQ